MWETADENPDLATDVLGQAGSAWRGRVSDGAGAYVTGEVRLGAQQSAALMGQPGGAQLGTTPCFTSSATSSGSTTSTTPRS